MSTTRYNYHLTDEFIIKKFINYFSRIKCTILYRALLHTESPFFFYNHTFAGLLKLHHRFKDTYNKHEMCIHIVGLILYIPLSICREI